MHLAPILYNIIDTHYNSKVVFCIQGRLISNIRAFSHIPTVIVVVWAIAQIKLVTLYNVVVYVTVYLLFHL